MNEIEYWFIFGISFTGGGGGGVRDRGGGSLKHI